MDQTSNSGTLRAITAITDSFVEAASRLENWRRVKKHRKSGESELRDSLEAGSDELRVGYQKLRQEYGEEFEQGDEISRSSLFRVANEVQQTIVDVLANAERAHGISSDLNPSELWQISEKTRKHAVFLMGELGLRIRKERARRSSYNANRPRLRVAASSLSMRSNALNGSPTLYTQERPRSFFEAPQERMHLPPSRYSMAIPLPSQPEYEEGPTSWSQSRQSRQPSWRTPPPEPIMQEDIPVSNQANDQSLPASLRIGVPAARPIPPMHRPRPTSYYSPTSSGTGFLSRIATVTPAPSQENSRSYPAAPLGRPNIRDRSSSDLRVESRGYPDARRATVGSSRFPQFGAGYASPEWSQKPTQPESSWAKRDTIYAPVSPYQDILDIGPNGNFKMPKAVNHGGHNDEY